MGAARDIHGLSIMQTQKVLRNTATGGKRMTAAQCVKKRWVSEHDGYVVTDPQKNGGYVKCDMYPPFLVVTFRFVGTAGGVAYGG